MDDLETWFGAARSGDVSLLASYALAYARTTSALGRTALMLAAENNHADACTILMDLEGGTLDNDGHSALFYAAQAGAHKACSVLLQNDQERGAESPFSFYTAALASRSQEILVDLLNTFPLDQGPGNIAVLSVAASNGSIELVRLLLDSGHVKFREICQALCYVKEPTDAVAALLREHLRAFHDIVNSSHPKEDYFTEFFTELQEEVYAVTKLLINAGLIKLSTQDRFAATDSSACSLGVSHGAIKKAQPPLISQLSYLGVVKDAIANAEAKYAALKSAMDQAMHDAPEYQGQYEAFMVDLWRLVHLQDNHLTNIQANTSHVCEVCGIYDAEFHKLRCENLQLLHEIVKLKKEIYKKDKQILDLTTERENAKSSVDSELDAIVTRVFSDIADFRDKLAYLKAVSLAKDEIIEEMRVELDKVKIGTLLYPKPITSIEQEREDICLGLSPTIQNKAVLSPQQGPGQHSIMRAPLISRVVETDEASTSTQAALELKIQEQDATISNLNAELNTILEAFNAAKHLSTDKLKKVTANVDLLIGEINRIAKLFDIKSPDGSVNTLPSAIVSHVVSLQSQLSKEKDDNKRCRELLKQQDNDIQYLMSKITSSGRKDADLSSIIAKYELLAEKIETTNQLVESLSREGSPVICRATSPLRISRSLTPAVYSATMSPGTTGAENLCSSPSGNQTIHAEAEIEKLRETISELTQLLVNKDEKIKSLLESISLLQAELITDDFSKDRPGIAHPSGAVANLTRSRLEAATSSTAEYQSVIRTLTEDRDNLREQLHLTVAENKELQMMNFSLQNSLSRTKSILEKSSVLVESLAGSNSPRKEPRAQRSPLHEATMHNDIERVKELIAHAGEVDERGNTSLMAASRLGYFEIASVLVSHESRYRNQFGDTALMFAAVSGHCSIVELLVPYEATIQNESGLTALMLAAEAGHIGCVQLLIGFEVRLVNKQYETALVLAAANDRPECVRVLAEYESGHRCISVDEKDGTGETALMRACKAGAKECVEILIGWEHDIPDKAGNMPVHYASDPCILSYFD
ncbi:Ankyrin repeat protein 1 [Giardia duodenalis]|uniref:Ankyrin repeat protein 1 n=1 Tax=Giardia intestinalis (strain ATCC 50803 / WB clone C6) TaxID=184922 RepID=A8BHY1_GIAIC|nr:Ankyrin repeat protein 1 [Giardia intestinalis]KAE8302615.1 Ankyrin repeat protein 1 [Giardia intestinalis]|eukprot:XP_001706943.1 Protein 21.1 [Giardia lamblia ATCC 50803]